MKRKLLRDEPAGKIWCVVGEDGAERFEVELMGHRLQSFERASEAQEHFNLWGPEIERDMDLFDR